MGARGFAGTLGLHASVVGLLALWTMLGRLPPVLVRTGQAFEMVEAPSASPVFSAANGFTFDTSRIRAHRTILFPFLTGELSFLDELRQNLETDRRRLLHAVHVLTRRPHPFR